MTTHSAAGNSTSVQPRRLKMGIAGIGQGGGGMLPSMATDA